MAPQKASKRALTPARAAGRLQGVQPRVVALLLLTLAGPLPAQAPAAAGLWRVATGTLARPAALEDGPTGAFWNPAADPHGRLTAGAQVVQTSDILGLSGFLAGATYRAGAFGHAVILVGRMDIRDLVRTTTSPNREPGEIPIYAQFAGVGLRLNDGPFALGTMVRLHDARFDADAEHGATIDLGVLVEPVSGVTLAASTQFLPVQLTSEPTTDYFVGAEYVWRARVGTDGLRTHGVGRYGVTLRESGAVDHALGVGVIINDTFRADLGLAGEAAYGTRSWRPALALALRVGRYTVGVARGEGLNDIGGTYRVLLDVEVAQ